LQKQFRILVNSYADEVFEMISESQYAKRLVQNESCET